MKRITKYVAFDVHQATTSVDAALIRGSRMVFRRHRPRANVSNACCASVTIHTYSRSGCVNVSRLVVVLGEECLEARVVAERVPAGVELLPSMTTMSQSTSVGICSIGKS